jgi:hypothetical protein
MYRPIFVTTISLTILLATTGPSGGGDVAKNPPKPKTAAAFVDHPVGPIIKEDTTCGAVAMAAESSPAPALAPDFYTFFTRIDSGEPFEKYSRTDEFADLVVNIGGRGGRLVFWRGTSYLPYWQVGDSKWSVPELISRKGDGDAKRPDRVNTFSHVHLIEQTPDRAIVLWRYLPQFGGGDPHTGIAPTRFAEETFDIARNGTILRTVRPCTEKYDDWVAGKGRLVQRIRLTPEGVQADPPVEEPIALGPIEPVTGSPVKNATIIAASRVWHFDEAMGDATAEAATGKSCPIAGHKSMWRRGVSGTALMFDGYTTDIQLPSDAAPAVDGGLTLVGWAAIGAYPWNWAPIVQQNDDAGYFLGVGPHGEAGFKVQIGDRWEELISEKRLPRYRWHQLAGTYEPSTGKMTIFVNGQPAGNKTVGPGPVNTASAPIRIGHGKPRRPSDPVRASTFEANYGFDGLIDEVCICGKAIDAEQVAAAYEQLRPDDPAKPDMVHRALPEAATGGRFGARYTHLKFHPSWDVLWRFGDWPDVVVGFDNSPARFVFWRGTGYIPMLVNGDRQWYSNEFNETWDRSGGQGCQEPMSDKESYTDHARILENTDARVVVQWRFPLKDVRHVYANWHADTGWADWADWYYYIYPDGVAVKRMHLWTDGPRNHEWQESMAILGPNQHPEQVIETKPALILADLDGYATRYSWTKGPPKQVDYRNQKVHMVNYKSEYKPFTIGDFTGGDVYGGEMTSYSVFPTWNHWPVSQIPSDGRYASSPDRAAHCSLTHLLMPDYKAAFGDRPYQEKLLMEGMSNRSPRELAMLARSWLRSPELKVIEGCSSGGYEPAERAYVLTANKSAMTVQVDASPERPLVNLCFVIYDWNTDRPATVATDGQTQARGPNFRQGIVRAPSGRQKLVLWIGQNVTRPIQFHVGGANQKPTSN